MEEVAENSRESPSTQETAENTERKSEAAGRTDILSIPARDEADDIIALMLAQLLE